MLIEVKQEHIDHGVKKDCKKCPVGLALKEASNGDDIFASLSALRIGRIAHKTPREVRGFMCLFDCDYSIKPFKFEFGGDILYEKTNTNKNS